MNKVKLFIRLAFIMAAAMIFSCTQKAKHEMYIVFYTGSVALQRTGTPIPVEVKGTVRENDVFTIGEKSMLILQSGDRLVIRFESDTEARISSINDISMREISLTRGKVLSSVEKLQKGHSYAVKTPTVLASVRGTRFLTEFIGNRSIVAVGNGSVSVKRVTGAGDEKLVETGNSVVSGEDNETLDLRTINKVETLELSKLEKTPVAENIHMKSPAELKELFKETEKIDEKINELIVKESGLTAAEMKEKYGRIDVITLYSGRIIKGVILSRGDIYRVLTPVGTITLKAKDVKRTDVR